MTRRRTSDALAGLAIAVPLAFGLVATPSGPARQRVFAFQDPAIVEASALVVDDGLFLTTNDSGDTGRVFAVDEAGHTVGVTHWSDDPTDTEALAPAGPGYVWVGDIGDNEARRTSVSIARIPVGRGDRVVHPTVYQLTYSDGPVNAETLVRDPTTGRLYIATKNVFGGQLYAVPARLSVSGPNVLRPVGRVLPVATDGAFFPDGKHLVVRSYTTAVVYDWPSLQPVGSFGLPHERQGEGIAVADDGRVYVSSEGPQSPVLQVSLPPAIAAAVQPPSTQAGQPTSATPDAAPVGEADDSSREVWPWLAGGLLGVVAIAVLVRAVRPH